MQAVAELGTQPATGPPRFASAGAYPIVGNAALYATCAVAILRTELAAEDSLAAILARKKLGMAIAAMIKMIATTMSSSIREKPRLVPRPQKRFGTCEIMMALWVEMCATQRPTA